MKDKTIEYLERRIIEQNREIKLLKERVRHLENLRSGYFNQGEIIFQSLVPNAIKQSFNSSFDFLCGHKKVEIKYAKECFSRMGKRLGIYRFHWGHVDRNREANRIILIGEYEDGKLTIIDLSRDDADALYFKGGSVKMQLFSTTHRYSWRYEILIKNSITKEILTKRYN
jgi:hypothetical protein